MRNDICPAKGYEGKSLAGFPYRDAMLKVDDIVGRLIGTLKDTGLLENILVFFTSDNGCNEDLMPDSGYQPFRGGKGTKWEGGVRVPGITYWQGTIKPGRVSIGLLDLTDMFNARWPLPASRKTMGFFGVRIDCVWCGGWFAGGAGRCPAL